jgi:CheY-like chemotaxis protein
MTTQQWIDACLRLIGYLVSWPVVTLTIVFILRKRILSTLTALAERTRTASVGPISVDFDPVAVGALQDTAREAAQSFGSDPDRLGDFLSEQIAKMAEQSPKQDERSISGSRILWADDNIAHNLFEMHYLQRLGARIETATTTEEALRVLDKDRFDLVISDMHRVEDGVEEPKAGLKLLEALRSRRHIPLVFYTANAVLLRDDPAVSAYGAAATDTANELFAEVKGMLSRRNPVGGLRRVIARPRRSPGASS